MNVVLKKTALLALWLFQAAVLAWTPSADAAQVEAAAGYYNIKAKAERGDIKIDDVGVLMLAYKVPVSDSFMMGLGYSMYTMPQAGNDMGYGLDVGADWYPQGTYRNVIADEPSLNWVNTRQWAYFVGARFAQRQYQSIQAGYAGVCGQVGLEFAATKYLRLQALGRFLQLKGPQDARITETNALIGVIRDL